MKGSGFPDSLRGPQVHDHWTQRMLSVPDWKPSNTWCGRSPGCAAAAHAVPFPDHYFPLLYALGAAQAGERVRHVFEGFQSGTLSMRCVQWS